MLNLKFAIFSRLKAKFTQVDRFRQEEASPFSSHRRGNRRKGARDTVKDCQEEGQGGGELGDDKDDIGISSENTFA